MTWTRVAIAAAAVLLGIYAFDLLHDDLHQTVVRSLPAVMIGWTATAAGLVALGRRQARRIGWLLIAFGLAILVRPWQYSEDQLVFTIGFAFGSLIYPLFAHVALAYPSGYVRDRYERLLLQVGYPIVVVIQLATLLVHEAGTRLTYAPLGPDSAILVWRNAELARALEKLFAIVVFGAPDRLLRRPRRAQARSGDTARPPRARPRAARRRGGVAAAPSTSSSTRSSTPSPPSPSTCTGGRWSGRSHCPLRSSSECSTRAWRRRTSPIWSESSTGSRRPISAARSQPRSAIRRSRSRYGCRIAGATQTSTAGRSNCRQTARDAQ